VRGKRGTGYSFLRRVPFSLGVEGRNYVSEMSNLSPFFPRREERVRSEMAGDLRSITGHQYGCQARGWSASRLVPVLVTGGARCREAHE
jgi:hypothetical protein